ncbi:hypothetical protein, partial [Mangrovihabitans endophyticus]|uniref:hypothetical protein n=1 Tax=Mangrovihabitans endophyticus TaxID=1751298 RepID=UPI001666A34E
SAFTQLAHRVESGNLTWEDVWSGAVEDDAGRVVAAWLDARVQQFEHAGRLIAGHGVPADQAYVQSLHQGDAR